MGKEMILFKLCDIIYLISLVDGIKLNKYLTLCIFHKLNTKNNLLKTGLKPQI